MTSISSVSAAPAAYRSSPVDEERQRVKQYVTGAPGDPRAPVATMSVGAVGGYGGGSAFMAHLIGGGEAVPAPGGGNGGGGVGAGGGVGEGSGPGPVGGGTGPAQPSAAHSMSSGDGFDLFTGSVIAGASAFPAESGLATGDFQLSSNEQGGVTFSLSTDNGFGNRVSIQRGASLDQVTSVEGAEYADGTTSQSIGPGDTAVIDYGGFMNYAVGNVRRNEDGSIGFDVKEIPAAGPSRAETSQPDRPSPEALAIADASPDASYEANAAEQQVSQAFVAAAIYASNMMAAASYGGSVVSDGSGGSSVSVGGGGGGSGAAAGVGASGGGATAAPASSGSSSAGSSGGSADASA